MEHEVNVPFSVGSVRAALAEPQRVARCVPGLQLDSAASAAGATEGRLRVRLGGSTITYRGSLTVTEHGEEFAVKGSGTEARGSGSVRLKLTVVPRRSRDGEGTRLVCSGTVRGDGRLKDVEPKTATAAGHRLLERFGAALGESIRDNPPEALDAPDAPAAEPAATEAPRAPRGIGEPGDNERVIPGIPGPEKGESRTSGETEAGAKPDAAADEAEPAADTGEPGSAGESGEADAGDADSGPDQPAGPDRPEHTGVFDTEIPPPSLEPDGGDEADDADEAAAEAAHARRTMIGRSAEEVDHAPPRGRYAPVPVPETITNSAALRWAAPAVAAVVAGAVVLGRALRRRR
ncbi:MAG: hypothetical protein ACRDP3_05185 [Streptomyces sp.]|uniref:hypothetical protein n=1 Tax=Streptomyces sp. TaxID=1931 RepID=UPI003D69FF76